MLDEGLKKDEITLQPCSHKGRFSYSVGGFVFCGNTIDNDSMCSNFFGFVLPGN